MQTPVFSYVISPLIYFMISIISENTRLYQNADIMADRFRAAFYENADTFDFIVGMLLINFNL